MPIVNTNRVGLPESPQTLAFDPQPLPHTSVVSGLGWQVPGGVTRSVEQCPIASCQNPTHAESVDEMVTAVATQPSYPGTGA